MASPRVAFFTVWFLLWTPHVSVSAEPSGTEESISGSSFRAIQIAELELKRHNLDIADYRIRVWRRASTLYVLFDDPNVDPNTDGLHVYGRLGKIPSFWVQLDPGDLHILKSAFAK